VQYHRCADALRRLGLLLDYPRSAGPWFTGFLGADDHGR